MKDINTFKLDREDVYNDVIQEYSELTYRTSDNTRNNIVDNLVDLVMEYGDDVYRFITLDEYDNTQLLDYHYLKFVMETIKQDYL